jgi:hypothetical protein
MAVPRCTHIYSLIKKYRRRRLNHHKEEVSLEKKNEVWRCARFPTNFLYNLEDDKTDDSASGCQGRIDGILNAYLKT